MTVRKITWLITVLFFCIMLLLTLSARSIHNAKLPKVKTGYLTYERFSHDEKKQYKDSNLQNEFTVGLPKELYNNHSIYKISIETVNGEERSIARRITELVLGSENEGYYEVVEGITVLDQIIFESNKILQDGDEVYIE